MSWENARHCFLHNFLHAFLQHIDLHARHQHGGDAVTRLGTSDSQPLTVTHSHHSGHPRGHINSWTVLQSITDVSD